MSMNSAIIGSAIRELREKRGLTQAELAEKLSVSDKTISKWETARGLPDISLLQILAQTLQVSVAELMKGEYTQNRNISGNLMRSRFYVCPICGNIIYGVGDAAINCCGVDLPALETEDEDDHHLLSIENVEDEHFVTTDHPMTKDHFISFFAYVTTGGIEIVKLYPEGNAQARFRLRGRGYLYYYCNRHGLFRELWK